MWLYQEGTTSAASGNRSETPGSSPYSDIKSFSEQLEDLKNTFKNFIAGENLNLIVTNAQEAMISMDNSAKSLMRSMGGFVDLTKNGGVAVNSFRGQLENAFFNLQDIGIEFKDITDTVTSLADNMGRMVLPSKEVMESMAIFTKSTNLASSDVGSMVTGIIRFGGTQKEALDTMHRIADESRILGLNTTKYMKDVNTNLKLVDGFGFKNGVKGVTDMVRQAQLLRTTIDAIGASALQSKVLTPEGAIEAAAGFQMLGGTVGGLADPFQLLYMAQNDLGGIQKELVNSTKAAYTFNKETGEFQASTEDLYRLRQQAEIVGINFDEMARAGREASKLDFIESKMNLSSLSEPQKGLIASLAQIDKGGRVVIDLPGFEEGGKTLEELANNTDFKTALDNYANQQGKTEKELALSQMTISESQAKDTSIIKHAVLNMLGLETRNKLVQELKQSNKEIGTTMTKFSTTTGQQTKELVNLQTGLEKTIAGSTEKIGAKVDSDAQANLSILLDKLKSGTYEIEDGYISNQGQSIIKTGKGEMFKTLPEDKIAIGTDLDKFLNQSMSLMETLNGKPNLNNYINESTTKINNLNNTTSVTKLENEQKVSGKIDVNINLSGTINGDRNANLDEIFNRPEFKNQIMDTVLTKLESYKKQQGVLTIS